MENPTMGGICINVRMDQTRPTVGPNRDIPIGSKGQGLVYGCYRSGPLLPENRSPMLHWGVRLVSKW